MKSAKISTQFLGFQKISQKVFENKKAVIGVFVLVLLPAVLMAVFFVQQYITKAGLQPVYPVYIRTLRESTSAGSVTFETAIPIIAQLSCASVKKGPYIFCGKDTEETVDHMINTTSAQFLLNPNTPYYVKIQTGSVETLTYIPAQEEGLGFGQTFSTFSTELLGACRDETDYDPAYDYNQDGCINLNDVSQIIE